MKILALLTLLLDLAAHLASNALAAPLPVAVDLPDLVEKILPGVVNISSTTVTRYTAYGMDDFFRLWGVPQTQKQTSLGSGFIIDKDGYVLTNFHVINHATEVAVTLWDKRQFTARIVGKDQKMDLALLQIRGKDHLIPENLKPVPLGDSDHVRIAESVFAVGNPFGLQHTVTLGIISAKNRTVGTGPFDNYLQTDASINPGNSGGPLFNLKGEVIGINTMIYSKVGQSGGVGFAIPANEASRLIPDLKKFGRVPRPWVGILAERMTPQLERYYELGTSEGVLIDNLVENGPADVGGLKQGDILLDLNEIPLHEPNDLERALSHLKPEQEAIFKIERGKKVFNKQILLKELPRLDELPAGII